MLTYKTGYTFKFPDSDDVNTYLLSNIRNYILEFEEALANGDDISPYIDYDSFAAWLLAQDILGQGDSAGANRYLIKKQFLPCGPNSKPDVYGASMKFRCNIQDTRKLVCLT